MAWAAVAGVIVAGALKAYSQYQQGKAAEKTAEFNAHAAEQEARQTEEATAYEVARHRDRTSRALATQRALFAKRGVVFTEGSPMEVMADTVYESSLDEQAITYEGAKKSASLQTQASLYRYQGKTAMQAAKIGMYTTILQTGTSAYGAYSGAGYGNTG